MNLQIARTRGFPLIFSNLIKNHYKVLQKLFQGGMLPNEANIDTPFPVSRLPDQPRLANPKVHFSNPQWSPRRNISDNMLESESPIEFAPGIIRTHRIGDVYTIKARESQL
jgi:hypothetical protein